MVKIVVNGIIGAGKTTLIPGLVRAFQDRGLTVACVSEPVDAWIETGIFEKFNQNIPEFAYRLQLLVIMSEINAACSKKKADITVYERDVSTTENIFALMLEKHFTDTEKKMIPEFFAMKSLIPDEPTYHIYLRPGLKTCMDRITKRGRIGEDKITDEYQAELLRYHDEYHKKIEKKIVIDTEDNFKDPKVIMAVVSQLDALMAK